MSASGQVRPEPGAAVSLDLVSAIMKERTDIGFSHPVSDGWSAEGRMSIPFPGSGQGTAEFIIGTRFWTGGFYEGIYLGIWCSHDTEGVMDMAAGFGYAAKLWKSISISAGYETKLAESIRERYFNTEGIRININYIF